MEEYSSGQTWGTGVWGSSKSSSRGPARGGTAQGRRSWEPAGRVGRSEGPQEGLQEQRWGHPHSPEARRWPSGQVSSSWVGKCCCCCLVAKSFPTFCDLMGCILHHLLEFAQIQWATHIWGLEVATQLGRHLWAGGGLLSSPAPTPCTPTGLQRCGVDAGAALGGHWHSVIKTSVSLMKSYPLPGRGETQIIMNQFSSDQPSARASRGGSQPCAGRGRRSPAPAQP